MSRYSEPICRLCRVEKTKLFLKGDKCLSDKCSVERRAYPPGQHGRARRRVLGYGLQLREKQKMKRFYGMSEKQFHLFFVRAEAQKGVTGETLLQMLERRLDNVLFIAGFSLSRAHARQLVCHGHVQINDRRVGVPSALVKAGDVIGFKVRSVKSEDLRAVVDSHASKTIPSWIEVDRPGLTARVASLPTRADVTLPVEEHMVVELYSK
jgi:small subunit ribosomal protein S4